MIVEGSGCWLCHWIILIVVVVVPFVVVIVLCGVMAGAAIEFVCVGVLVCLCGGACVFLRVWCWGWVVFCSGVIGRC